MCALDHKHPVTPEVRADDEYGKRVKNEDRHNTGAAKALLGKVSTSTIKFEEEHDTSRTSNGKCDNSSRPDDSEVDEPGGIKKPNA